MIRRALFSYGGVMGLVLIAGLVFSFCLGIAVAAPNSASPQLALKSQVTDADGKVTLGELFDYAGSSSDMVIAERKGPSVVLDAVRVQLLVQSLGLYWDNPHGLKRIIVTGVGEMPEKALPVSDVVPRTAKTEATPPQAQPAMAPVVIRRGDLVSVTWRSQGLTLRANGVAQRDGRLGERTTLINPASKKPIEDVILTGPGTAESGPLAQSPALSFASR